ncbi:MAG: hypothetical protein IKB79_01195 [Oscillospiraceae bacterium]|nr:hypothetical protein [Oscillospiraceae bacterium]
MKETQEGCLSRLIKPNFGLFKVQNLQQLGKKFFAKLYGPFPAGNSP